MDIKSIIENGQASLGIELGSTRVKAVLIDSTTQEILALGSSTWENRLEQGIWTYHEDEIYSCLQASYKNLKNQVQDKYQVVLKKLKAIGISAMMHGFLALDKDDKLVAPFKTWRNTNAREASSKLTYELNYNIPERWSIAHLYDAMLKHEAYVPAIKFMSTLSGFIHYKLTDKKVLGIGDASGMFAIDYVKHDFLASKVEIYNKLASALGYGNFNLTEIFPKVLVSGEDAGYLTNQGAILLDPQGDLEAGCPLCPPEGDAGTGMVATNAIKT
jgi:sugar (pentulose or hexulose) kinase